VDVDSAKMMSDYTISSHVCRAPVSLSRRPTSLLVGVAMGVGGVLACNGKMWEISEWTGVKKVTTTGLFTILTSRGKRQAQVGLTDSAGVVVVTVTERGVGSNITCSGGPIRRRLVLQPEFDNSMWADRVQTK